MFYLCSFFLLLPSVLKMSYVRGRSEGRVKGRVLKGQPNEDMKSKQM